MSDEARRRFGRFARELDVEIDHDGDVHAGRTENIGLGGILVFTDAPLEFGQRVTITMQVPDPAQRVEAGATVMWRRPGDTPSIGLAFDALRPIDVWALLQYFNLSSQESGISPLSD